MKTPYPNLRKEANDNMNKLNRLVNVTAVYIGFVRLAQVERRG